LLRLRDRFRRFGVAGRITIHGMANLLAAVVDGLELRMIADPSDQLAGHTRHFRDPWSGRCCTIRAEWASVTEDGLRVTYPMWCGQRFRPASGGSTGRKARAARWPHSALLLVQPLLLRV
jgi:hypothetical protein